jgi:hypothetical protein
MARMALMRVSHLDSLRVVEAVVDEVEEDVEVEVEVEVVGVVDVVVDPLRLGVRLSRILLRRGRGKRLIREVGRTIIVDNSMRKRWRVAVACLAKRLDRYIPYGCLGLL